MEVIGIYFFEEGAKLDLLAKSFNLDSQSLKFTGFYMLLCSVRVKRGKSV